MVITAHSRCEPVAFHEDMCRSSHRHCLCFGCEEPFEVTRVEAGRKLWGDLYSFPAASFW